MLFWLARVYGWSWRDVIATPGSVVETQTRLAILSQKADNDSQAAALATLLGHA